MIPTIYKTNNKPKMTKTAKSHHQNAGQNYYIETANKTFRNVVKS
jgi:hypothetical protein